MSDMFYCDEAVYDLRDDAAAADLAGERRETTLRAIYHAAMLGLEEAELRLLCAACGLAYADLDAYTPPILRRPQPQPGGDTDAPF